MALDQAPRDRSAGAVELGRAVGGLPEQDDPGRGETVEGRGEGRILDVWQRLGPPLAVARPSGGAAEASGAGARRGAAGAR